MATAGAIVGLRVPGVTVDDIGCTDKTIPDFPAGWAALLEGLRRVAGRAREYDESDVRVRPGRRGSRPRTKRRPEHADAAPAMVTTVDRGRWTCAPDGDSTRPPVTAMRARELGRTPVVVGDRVDLVGDLSGDAGHARPDRPRRTTGPPCCAAPPTTPTPYERVVVANADQLFIVTAVADPPPRTGFVDRCLVAAYAGGLEPVLCLTKSDLADPEPFAAQYADLDLPVLVTGRDDLWTGSRRCARSCRAGCRRWSGTPASGKSTLVNLLVPDADLAVGRVSGVGKGRHTTVAAIALPLPADGWVVSTRRGCARSGSRTSPRTTSSPRSATSRPRSRTARAVVVISGRPPTRSAHWTTGSRPVRWRPADSVHCGGSWWH